MKKTCLIALVFLTAWLSFQSNACSGLSITGLVRQPVNLALKDLERFNSIKVQLNEVMTDGGFRGVFYYTGVPLRTLLEMADIQKEGRAFHKTVDLAIWIRGENGKGVALSWGEVFYKNPGRILIATSARPVMPKNSCSGCHGPEEYQPRMDQFKRHIVFPKLVISSDTFADRCMDGVTSIQVIDLRPGMKAYQTDNPYSKAFSVNGPKAKEKTFKKLSGFPRTKTALKNLGEGNGYHGIDIYEGALLKPLLDTLELDPDLNQVFLVSAPDGYRTLFSYGEIYLDPSGEHMLVADKINGKRIKEGGKFTLVSPDDLMSDRNVKALHKIDVISLHEPPKLYAIGVGCAETALITLEAISGMAKCDAFIAPPDITQRFAKYISNKPILVDICEFAPPKIKEQNPGLPQEGLDRILQENRAEAANSINQYLQTGRSVGILDYGDPSIRSGWSWLMEYFPEEQLEIIPGLSSFNVSAALLKKRPGCNGSVILTTSEGILENPMMLPPLAKKGETLCISMGLENTEALATELKKHYPSDTPACLVYRAGYSGSEHLIWTDLQGLKKATDEYPEKDPGLIYIGPCLK